VWTLTVVDSTFGSLPHGCTNRNDFSINALAQGLSIGFMHDELYHARIWERDSEGEDVPNRLSAERIRKLAVSGAEALLAQLRAEVVAIERTFPELALPKRRRQVRRSLKTAQTRTRQMSAAARKAVSQRMKKYWAERRKAQAKVK
jgi:hypothetical protein